MMMFNLMINLQLVPITRGVCSFRFPSPITKVYMSKKINLFVKLISVQTRTHCTSASNRNERWTEVAGIILDVRQIGI